MRIAWQRSAVGSGKLGAAAFWSRYRNDTSFQRRTLRSWKQQHHDKKKIIAAASLGGKALWRRYREDTQFRAALDSKLGASRAKGGSISLRNLGEVGFKSRLNRGPLRVRATYSDVLGNPLRSSLEVKVANALANHKIDYMVEPRFVVGDHAFYPDFLVMGDLPKLIEVVGYMGDAYWNGTASKIKMIVDAYPRVHIALVTSFIKIMKDRLGETPRVSLFRPYQEDELVRWCRERAGVAEWLMRGP